MRAFDHILIVMFENEFRGTVMRNEFMRELAAQGRDLSNYHGVYHPSQTNYIASIAGEVCGVSTDGDLYPPRTQQTIVDQLETTASQLTWKAYIENYPQVAWNESWTTPQPNPLLQPPYTTPGTSNPPYHRKHNPFASFQSIQRSAVKWQRIVDYSELGLDIDQGDLPSYGWVTPNIWNDGHYRRGTQTIGDDADALVEQSATWLRDDFLPLIGGPRLSRLPPKTLVVITWDEAAFLHPQLRAFYEGPNQVYTILLGGMVKPLVDSRPYNHYSLLRSIEHNFGIPSLEKNDMGAARLRFLEGARFDWQKSVVTNLPPCKDLALAMVEDIPHAVFREASGGLFATRHQGESWSRPEPLAMNAITAPQLAASDHGMMLVYAEKETGELHWSHYTKTKGWFESRTLGVACEGSPALCTFRDPGSKDTKLMLVFRPRSEPGLAFLQWLTEGYGVTTPAWQTHPTALPFYDAQHLALGFLPHSLLLCWNRGSDGVVETASQNRAEFNAVAAQFPNQTTCGLWSPRSYAARHYHGSESAGRPQSFNSQGPLVSACFGGEMFLFYTPSDTEPMRATVFSLPGLMTAKHVNGDQYGTLAEAGWGPSESFSDKGLVGGVPLAAAATSREIWLLYKARDSDSVQLMRGGWVGSAVEEDKT